MKGNATKGNNDLKNFKQIQVKNKIGRFFNLNSLYN